MDQVAGAAMFVSFGVLGALQIAKAPKPMTSEDARDCSRRKLEIARDLRTCHPRPTQHHHHVFPPRRRVVRTPTWARGPVLQCTLTAPHQPLVRSDSANAGRSRGGANRPSLFRDSSDEQGSTCRAGACSTVEVHPGLLGVGCSKA